MGLRVKHPLIEGYQAVIAKQQIQILEYKKDFSHNQFNKINKNVTFNVSAKKKLCWTSSFEESS